MEDDSCSARELENMASDEDDEIGVRDDVKVVEWVEGLPSRDDIVPLSQPLVTPELASAFSIPPPELKTMVDIHRAAQHTASNLRRQHNLSKSSSQKPIRCAETGAGSNSSMATMGEIEGDSAEDNSGRMLKRPRLVWTPQLHKRFVDVVAHLGIKNAVPKTIMQLMNVDGLSRENVASHLQKYRLYLKRMQGISNEGPSTSDHLFASLHEKQPMPFAVPKLIPMQVYGLPHHRANGVPSVNDLQGPQLCNGFDSLQPHALPNDSSGGTEFGSILYNPYASLPNHNLRTGEKQQQQQQ